MYYALQVPWFLLCKTTRLGGFFTPALSKKSWMRSFARLSPSSPSLEDTSEKRTRSAQFKLRRYGILFSSLIFPCSLILRLLLHAPLVLRGSEVWIATTQFTRYDFVNCTCYVRRTGSLNDYVVVDGVFLETRDVLQFWKNHHGSSVCRSHVCHISFLWWVLMPHIIPRFFTPVNRENENF